jgi:hypothetical protein
VGEEVGVCGCYGFVEGDFGGGAGLDYYGAGFIAEDAITGGVSNWCLGECIGNLLTSGSVAEGLQLGGVEIFGSHGLLHGIS